MSGLIPAKKPVQAKTRNTTGASETADLERGKQSRFFLSLPVELSHGGPGKRLSYTMDIGETGLTLYIHQKLEVGENLQLKLFFSYKSNSHVLDISSQIIWIKNQSEGNNVDGGYIAGVKFVNRAPKEEEVLRSFLAYLDMQVPVENYSPPTLMAHPNDIPE